MGSSSSVNTVFQIRGQSKAQAGNSAPAVISYFADVPSPNLASGIATYDLDSVQVLKGPQGTLFGRNTTGGAVLYYPVTPDYELGGSVEVQYGNYDERRLEARSEEHTSELQSLMRISYAVFCLKKKQNKHEIQENNQ